MKKRIITAAGLGGLALALVAPTAAQAHDLTVEADCEGWEASAWAYDREAVGTVTVDGTVVFGPATFEGAGNLFGAWTTEADTHTVRVVIDSTHDQFDRDITRTAEGCAPEPPAPVVNPHIQDYIGECDAAFVLDNLGSTLPVVYTINGLTFPVPGGTAIHTDADGTRIEPLEDGTYVIVTDTGQRWVFQGQVCIDTPPVITDPPVTTPVPEVPPTGGEVIPPVYEEAPLQDCPADAPIRAEDGSCVPEEFFQTPSAPAPSLAPRITATPENHSAPTAQEATLPQTGAEEYAGPLTIFSVFLVLMAGGFFVADYRKRKANGEHVDAG